MVMVKSAQGNIQISVKVTEDIMEGIIVIMFTL